MPKVKTTIPDQSRNKGERNIELPQYINRFLPSFTSPKWGEAEFWRSVVANIPFATVCRDTLISNLLALDWKIEPRDSTKRDEHKKEIEYYTRFFEHTGDFDYVEIIEWTGKDMLDLPFGGSVEAGREGDDPEGKLLWIELLDGGTLFPTLNSDWPVGQALKEMPSKTVVFPKHAINRVYVSPRTEIKMRGWGMPPPEKIFLAMELLRRGDVYYANLLLDTPESGILDLIDMSKDSATAWVESWREMLGGIDPLKIPVLYEHDKPAVFIPFTRSPTEIMFNDAVAKYAAITAAGYWMTLSDIGVSAGSSGGDTLAGSIRQERKTRRTGMALMKRKYTAFFNRLLPEYLEWKFIDLDDEVSVALGRARLANATAFQLLVDKHIVLPNEARQQIIADGLISISVPESVEGGDEFPQPIASGNNYSADKESDNKTQERPGMLGVPVAPSQGGHGEVKNSFAVANLITQSVVNTVKKCLSKSDSGAENIDNSITLNDNDITQILSEEIDKLTNLEE